jgi:cysteine desulfurase / selenocysteine lyase
LEVNKRKQRIVLIYLLKPYILAIKYTIVMQISKVRELFPITKVVLPKTETATERKLIYMDHGASTHAPIPVLNKFMDVMENSYANVHRGEHTLSKLSTDQFENVNNWIAKLCGVRNLENSGMEVILTSNTTSSLDLVSHIFSNIPGDYVTTVIEHHSNDLPHRNRGIVHRVNIDENATLSYDHLEEILQNNNVKLVAVTAASNVTGYVPDVHKIARLTHDNNAKILLDGAQRMAHMEIDVKEKDHPEHIDFLAAGGHKMYSPFGSSFIIGNEDDFNYAPPYLPSGGTVTFVGDMEVNHLIGPERHMFGTPNIAGSIALGEAAKFLLDISLNEIRSHELHLLKKMLKGLNQIPDVNVYGNIPIEKRIGVVTFNIGEHNHAIVSRKLDEMAGIATRNGTFCAQPYMQRLLQLSAEDIEIIKDLSETCTSLKLPGAVRATLGIYNSEEEVDIFLDTVEKISKSPVEKVQSSLDVVKMYQ